MARTVRSALRTRTRLLLAALVCVQVAVPLWATVEGVPHKFGFHMFTGYEAFGVDVSDRSGEKVVVDLRDWIVVAREDIDWAPRLAPAICATVPDAATVTVRQWGEHRTRSC
ncbi:hypothetical protein IEZ26_20480 [Nocardioides cavernae]|uniref:Uncharacterized protein n=1 Tax=Nocardioides cavernae TaxID=1921566 RepID=A0ABR8NFV6_9ACTN|nr:hypothetical protein [Nocardioides cavernae]MBD3927009.1 hypothetical protein [Nocardioides cavernae]MBM7512729.1 hypothetical protein [Nocardioides cavernae]